MVRTCSKCATENPDSNKFCSNCGAPLPEVKTVEVAEKETEIDRVKRLWKNREITHEEYRARLLKLKLREHFGVLVEEDEK
jgi:hypothetical protein